MTLAPMDDRLAARNFKYRDEARSLLERLAADADIDGRLISKIVKGSLAAKAVCER